MEVINTVKLTPEFIVSRNDGQHFEYIHEKLYLSIIDQQNFLRGVGLHNRNAFAGYEVKIQLADSVSPMYRQHLTDALTECGWTDADWIEMYGDMGCDVSPFDFPDSNLTIDEVNELINICRSVPYDAYDRAWKE